MTKEPPASALTKPRGLYEQPDDWTEPGAHPVVPGVTRIPLRIPADGLKAVNVYVIEDGQRLLVVDSGWATPVTFFELSSSLDSMGREPGEIGRFAITHAHHDHYTHALELRTRFGCRVSLGRGEAHSIARYAVDGSSAHVANLRRAGATALAADYAALKERDTVEDDAPWGDPDFWLDHGTQLRVEDRALDVLATPGHTRGHVVFRDPQDGLLFAGDHILPHITPSIGYEAAPEDLPLSSYLASLRLVSDLPDTLLLPAHGPVVASTHVRVDELLQHHEERFAQVLARLEMGDSTAFEVARALRWTRQHRPLADLDITNRALAIMETKAHLDVLVTDGTVRVEDLDGTDHYEVRASRQRSGNTSVEE